MNIIEALTYQYEAATCPKTKAAIFDLRHQVRLLNGIPADPETVEEMRARLVEEVSMHRRSLASAIARLDAHVEVYP